MAEIVLQALRAMRPPFILYEIDLHHLVECRLDECGLEYRHEAAIAKGCRIDYLVGDVGVEIKKGKPRAETLVRQLSRYAASDQVNSLVVVSWQSVGLPKKLNGKPIYPLALAKLWGVSLP